MNNWDEIRTAAQVARSGTISAAADILGVHRATINRHLDVLETALGAKLFLRHARGVTPTELGHELLRVADATEDQFGQLQRRAKTGGDALCGELVITTLDVLVEEVYPALKTFGGKHPGVICKIISSESLLKLEYGEAHIAFRAGAKPNAPDNVVRPFKEIEMGIYATTDYINRNGMPEEGSLAAHKFVGPASKEPRAPYLAWISENVPDQAITFTSDQMLVLAGAVTSGLGIGFLPAATARQNADIVEVLAPRPEWNVTTWVVTHIDLNRSAKVQAFLHLLYEKK